MSGAWRISTRVAMAVALAVAAFFLVVAPAPAGKGKKKIVSPTVVEVDRATDISPDELMVWGDLDAGDRRCINNRKVIVRINFSDAPSEFVDVARTGSTGAWAAIGPLDLIDGKDIESFVATAQKRKKKLSKRKSLICKKDTGAFALDMMM